MKDWGLPVAIIIISSLALMGLVLGVFLSEVHQDTLDQQDRCQEYCNCSVTNNCSYTFDYDKVKTCECER